MEPLQNDCNNQERTFQYDEDFHSFLGLHIPSSGSFWTEPRCDFISSVADERKIAKEFNEHVEFLELYRRYFYEKEHFNFLATHSNHGPLLMSAVHKVQRLNCIELKILLRTQEQTYYYSSDNSYSTTELSNTNSEDSDSQCSCVEPAINPELDLSNPVQLAKIVIKDLEVEGFCPLPLPTASQMILNFDEYNLQTRFKFGVIYQKAGQYTQEELLSNVDHSVQFENFLNNLGKFQILPFLLTILKHFIFFQVKK